MEANVQRAPPAPRQYSPTPETMSVVTMQVRTYTGSPDVDLVCADRWIETTRAAEVKWGMVVPDQAMLAALLDKLEGPAREAAERARVETTEALFSVLRDSFPRPAFQRALVERIRSGHAFRGLRRITAVYRLRALAAELDDQPAGLLALARATQRLFERPWSRVGCRLDTISWESLDAALAALKDELARDECVQPRLFGAALADA
ncbi:hypothetical protein H4R18_001446 [Coemansia javaensis]|uniref:Uncharacterized protein n=1 Tax=Coemansia javaensis TaxID=2761396 RepID=A0A9W8HH55_9FUNG|nr:hypothetical protein H4R18_001446 [Coemansia javaensis]